MTEYVLLGDLPKDHPYRNTPLRDMKAETCTHGSKLWRAVGAWRIGAAPFNRLGIAWTETGAFRVAVSRGSQA